jgi:protein gp37
MAENTKIEWADDTFNPAIGCQHVSPGCDHCYAETQNAFGKWTADGSWGPHAARRRTSVAYWKKPLAWNEAALRLGRRRRVFCASLSDWLDNQWDKEWRSDLCQLIEATPNLDWLLLSKRIENYRKLVPPSWQGGPPANVWLGVTAEDGEHYRQRWPILSAIPAAVRFISYEPAIGPMGQLDLGDGRVPDWIIFGGESGAHARSVNPTWAREVRDQCASLGVAYFLKQFGTYAANPLVLEQGLSKAEAKVRDPVENGKGGGLLDGQLWRQYPVARQAAALDKQIDGGMAVLPQEG